MLLFLLAPAASAQNTKGDRPVGNQRQVRETKSKSVKRKERGKTKDIAGRRLRTKGRSSANRANTKFPRPSTASRQPASGRERAAAPRGRVFSRSPRESKSRAWKGDVSGYPVRRIKPQGVDHARTNVYPQKGPYVRYARKKPKERPPVYKRTIKGKKFVEHKPRAQERAWTGGLQHGPLRNQSATGKVRNTYSQRGRYASSFTRHPKGKAKVYSNRSQVAKVKRYTKAPKTGGAQPSFFPASRSKSYIQRGRKNVYWGKYQKKEKGVTTDLTGGPVRTRNYRSPAAGLVGRDSLAYFNRHPRGDNARVSAGGYPTATKRARGWKGDVAGWPVRSPRKQRDHRQGPVPVTQPGIGGTFLAKTFNWRFRGVKPKYRIPDTREAKYQGNIPQSKGFADQGIGYSGTIKGGKGGFSRAGANYSGNIRGGKGGFSRAGANYSGNLKGGRAGFSRAGYNYVGRTHRRPGFSGPYVGYSGNVKRSSLSEFSGKGFGYSGFIKRSSIKGFSRTGANYAGNLKRGKGFRGDYVGYSGNLRRGQTGFSHAGANYSGNLKRNKGFNMDYVGYSGNIEYIGRVKQFGENGVGYSGFNKRAPTGYSRQGAGYPGNIKRSSMIGFNREGPGYAGNIRTKRAPKGGGSVSGFWNNNGLPLAKSAPVSSGGADFSGRTKSKRPAKGGGSVSGVLWNNQESALPKKFPGTLAGLDFSGHSKAKKPAKGGGSVSGVLWNNNEKALPKSPPDNAGAPSGLQVPVKQAKYAKKPNAAKLSMPGIAPTQASVKASEYSRSMKMYWNYKHNPASARVAMKTIAPGKADARIRDYQGNVKMHKYKLSGLHPDAKFAHSEEDNVKGERSLLTDVKLFWEKMFHKNGGQPSSVKEKSKKLQYDKREKGLWAY